jgi:hypothetical protein
MTVWSMVVLLLKRELNGQLQCFLVCNLQVYCVLVLLVVMEWTATITGDHVGLFLEFFSMEKNCGRPFSKRQKRKLNVFVLFSVVELVAPLFLKWPMTQLFLAA